jgi:hypothetical protein
MKPNIARATFVIVSVTAIWAATAVPAVAQHFPGIGTVMTYNVNEDRSPKSIVEFNLTSGWQWFGGDDEAGV